MSGPNLQQIVQAGVRHHQAGRLAEAQHLYEQVLAHRPDHADALHLTGLIAHQSGRNRVAVDLIRKAIAIRPNFPQAHCNLGNVLRIAGQVDAAIAACRMAILLKPGFPEAHSNLGNALQDLGRIDDAVAAYRQAVSLKPDYPEALSNLGAALRGPENLPEALDACRRAITLRPDYAEAHSNLGIALHEDQRLDEAIAAYRHALSLNPNLPETHYNLGTALRDHGRIDDALAAYRQAITLRPNYAQAHQILGMTLLLIGDFANGWRGYEWRWQCGDFPRAHWDLSVPRWDGSDLAGRTIFVHAEQGFGDTFQFVRFLPLVAARGGRVIFGCDPLVRRLLEHVEGIDRWLSFGEPLPPAHVHCPLMSLPFVLGTTLPSIPRAVPYIHPQPDVIAYWRQVVAGDKRESPAILNVGLVWAGRPTNRRDRIRSLPLSAFAPLAQAVRPSSQQAANVTFWSLQKGDAAAQAKDPPAGMRLVDRMDELKEFADTAGLITNLDMVISVDTAVAHLAGAMGKPVWLLLPFVPDWRWMLDRDESPWYPTMRLFRQRSAGDWDGVIQRIAAQLMRLMATRRQLIS